jgi:cytochrome P450
MTAVENPPTEDTNAPSFNPLDPALDADPHPILRELRASCPVHYESALGMYIVTGYEEGRQAFRMAGGEHRYIDFQKQRQGPGVENEPYCQGMSKWVLMQEGEDHRRQRATVVRHFTQARVDKMYPAMIEMAHDLIDRFADRGEVEIVEAYGNALPLAIISALLGVPDEDQPKLEHWMEGFNAQPVRPQQAGRRVRRLPHPGRGAVPDRIRNPSGGRDQRDAGSECRENDAQAIPS